MENVASELNKIIEETGEKLNNISKEEWDFRRAPGKWSKREILGHLIDSAANNHQRFVRVQYEKIPAIKYDQNIWCEVQDYDNTSIINLITFWISYNKHIAHVISGIPKEKYNLLCEVGNEKPVSIEWIASDYIRHLKHHLNQIIEN